MAEAAAKATSAERVRAKLGLTEEESRDYADRATTRFLSLLGCTVVRDFGELKLAA